MIPFSPITLTALGECTGFSLVDTTDYAAVVNNAYRPFYFNKGFRLIRVTYPNGGIKLFCTFDNINQVTNQLVIDMSTDTTVTPANNTTFTMDINSTQQGVFTVDILSIPYPHSTFRPSDFMTDDLCIREISSAPGRYVVYKAVIDNPDYDFDNSVPPTDQWVQINIDDLFSEVPAQNINSASITLDCGNAPPNNFTEAVACIFSNYEESFCKGCGCGDICKNKKSNNIMKATMMLRELELIKDNEFLYNQKLALYEPIMITLCRCS